MVSQIVQYGNYLFGKAKFFKWAKTVLERQKMTAKGGKRKGT